MMLKLEMLFKKVLKCFRNRILQFFRLLVPILQRKRYAGILRPKLQLQFSAHPRIDNFMAWLYIQHIESNHLHHIQSSLSSSICKINYLPLQTRTPQTAACAPTFVSDVNDRN